MFRGVNIAWKMEDGHPGKAGVNAQDPVGVESEGL